MANCDLSETGRSKVELVFNIGKCDRFHSQFVSVSFLNKSNLPPKVANADI